MRLVGQTRCTSCGGVQRVCYIADAPGMSECWFCGAMAGVPIGPQYQSVLVPETHAHAVIDDVLDGVHRRAIRAGLS